MTHTIADFKVGQRVRVKRLSPGIIDDDGAFVGSVFTVVEVYPDDQWCVGQVGAVGLDGSAGSISGYRWHPFDLEILSDAPAAEPDRYVPQVGDVIELGRGEIVVVNRVNGSNWPVWGARTCAPKYCRLLYRAKPEALEVFASADSLRYMASVRKVEPNAWFCTFGGVGPHAIAGDFSAELTGDCRWLSGEYGNVFRLQLKKGEAHPESAKRWFERERAKETSGNDEAGSGDAAHRETAAATPSGEAVCRSPQPASSPRPVCACGQEVPPRDAEKFTEALDTPPADVCADCYTDAGRGFSPSERQPLDTRIAAAQRAPEAAPWPWQAWSTPSSEGEG